MECFVSYNPATGAEDGCYPLMAAEEVACAVAKARAGADAWAADWRERRAALGRLREGCLEKADLLAESIVRNIGKPRQEAYGAELLPSVQALRWLDKSAGSVLRDRRIPGRRGARMTALPYGVVGVIGTWNYPLYLNLTPIAWALAAGNAVVWKPSELATGVASVLQACFERAALPVFMVTGTGETGRALVQAGCDKIVFTGGVHTGRAILAELAETGTPSVMELSGNDAMLVCADADIELAARSAVWGRFSNAGQSCVAPQRIYVVAERYEAFLRVCQEITDGLRVGIDIGPVRTEGQLDRADFLVRGAVAEGARLCAGGRRLERPGFYYAPTLLAGCQETMAIVREEVVGPGLPVCRVSDEAEAVARINANSMALGASLWTTDRMRGQRLADRLHVGLVAINDVLLDAADPALPFGGMRASGFGKQRGRAGLEEFVQWRVVSAHRSGGVRRHLFPYREATLPILRGVIALQRAKGVGEKLRAARALGQAAMRWERDANDERRD